jgi:hypothetical protein
MPGGPLSAADGSSTLGQLPADTPQTATGAEPPTLAELAGNPPPQTAAGAEPPTLAELAGNPPPQTAAGAEPPPTTAEITRPSIERTGPAAYLTGGAPPADLLSAGTASADAPSTEAQPKNARPREAGPREAGPTEGHDPDVIDAGVSADSPDGDAEAGAPEVELSDTEVAEVLSGRVIPIGAFFGQPTPAGDDAADMAGATFLADAARMTFGWAQRRSLGLTSACGICLALAVCAAAWFSSGTRADIVRGVAALWGGYLVLRAGQRLLQLSGHEAEAHRPAAFASAESPAESSSPEAVLRPSPGQELAMMPARNATDRRRIGPAAWLAALGGTLAECAVYAGLAIGAAAERWSDTWNLAIAVLGMVAVRNLMTACSTPPGFSERSDGAFRRISEAVLTMPVGGRVLVIGIVAPFWGARAALLALLDWAIISIGYGIAGRAAAGVTAQAGDRGKPGPAGPRSTLIRLRDDGALARTLGVLVRGNLMPLPPAILGLAAVSALAFLGLHGLPGALMIAPAIVMLLAAPGAGHPHTGRFDWLVPVLLLGAQVLYLAAIGLAAKVPGAVIFALIAAIVLRYTDLARPDRPVQLARLRDPDAEPVERGTSLGWEGRLLFAGLAAAMGVATFAYLALTAYLGVLICAKVVTSCLAPQEEVRP